MLLGDLLPLYCSLPPTPFSPLPLFLICFCNPPHSFPSALPLFLPPHLSVFKLMLNSPSDHAPQLLTQVCTNYQGEKARMGCTLKNQITFVAVCIISNSWCTICNFQRASLCEIFKLRTSS